jgi:hypothetical protein
MPTPKPRPDEILVKALVRAHRWRRKIESGQARSVTDLAEQEGVTDAYVCRLLPLTCLAPDIVETVLDGRQPKGLRLAEMLGIARSYGTSSAAAAPFSKRNLLPAARSGRALTAASRGSCEFPPRYAEAFCWSRRPCLRPRARGPLTSQVWRTSHRKRRRNCYQQIKFESNSVA